MVCSLPEKMRKIVRGHSVYIIQEFDLGKIEGSLKENVCWFEHWQVEDTVIKTKRLSKLY